MTAVRVSVTQLDAGLMGQPQRGRPRPTTVLVDVIDDDAVVAQHATAWATARGYDRLVGSLGRIFADPPKSGYAAIINKTHGLLVFASWPWCPAPHIIEGEPSTQWPEHEVKPT